jgi:hypothetical protein
MRPWGVRVAPRRRTAARTLPLGVAVYGIITDKDERFRYFAIGSPVPIGGTMSLWLWVLLGILGFFAVSFLVGLAVAAILASIGREFSGLIEFESLESSPLTHPADSATETSQQHLVGGRSSGLRLE